MGFKDLFKKRDKKAPDKVEQENKEENVELQDKEKKVEDSNIQPKAKEEKPKSEADSASVAYFSMVDNLPRTPIYRLYRNYCNENGIKKLESGDFAQTMFDESNTDGIFLTSVEKKSFLYSCLSDINKMYSEYENEKEKAFENMKNGIIANARKQAADKGEDEMEAELAAVKDLVNPFTSYDSMVKCFTTSDDMVAYCFVTPKIDNGTELTGDLLNKSLETSKINTNIDEEKVKALLENPTYFKFIRIAKGTKAIDGTDGYVEDLFDRNSEIKLKENKQGQVDYKDLGTYSSIKKDAVICKITKAVKGTPGITVKGKTLKAYNGKEPQIPRGEGTSLTADGLELRATTDGYITFEHGKFVVKQKMFINGNVDSSTGNIIFNGDVEVKGDVTSGFTIDVTGNIKVYGVVEGATLKAGGDISLKGGVSGNNIAKLEAKGVVKSLFLENCEVQSNSGVFTESIIQSDVFSDTVVDCLRGKGTIIGGNIHAKDGVMANVIGSRSGKLTTVNLGKLFSAASRQEELEQRLKEEREYFEKINKNVDFLNSLPSIPENKLPLYEQLKEQKVAYAEKIEEDNNELEELIANKTDYDKCLLKTGVLYEPVKLFIGPASKNLPAGQAVCYKYSEEERDIVMTAYH